MYCNFDPAYITLNITDLTGDGTGTLHILATQILRYYATQSTATPEASLYIYALSLANISPVLVVDGVNMFAYGSLCGVAALAILQG